MTGKLDGRETSPRALLTLSSRHVKGVFNADQPIGARDPASRHPQCIRPAQQPPVACTALGTST